MATGECGAGAEPARPRVIIVGVGDSAEVEAAHRTVRDAEQRKDAVLLVHVCEMPILPPWGAVAGPPHGIRRAKRYSTLRAGGLVFQPTMHLVLLVKIDTPWSCCHPSPRRPI
jgi:hypothetical protein